MSQINLMRGNDLRTADGGVDLSLQKEVEQCPEHDDRGKLADLVPCGRDGRSENVRGELELEPESEPSSEVESDLVADLFPAPIGSSQDRAQRSNDCLKGRKADDQGGGAFNAHRQVQCACFEDVLDHRTALMGEVL
jgi:hypothetical protein